MNIHWNDNPRIFACKTERSSFSIHYGRDEAAHTAVLWLRGKVSALLHTTLADALKKELQTYSTLWLVLQDVISISAACLKEIVTVQIIADREQKNIEIVNAPADIMQEIKGQGIDQLMSITEKSLPPPPESSTPLPPLDTPDSPRVTVMLINCSDQWSAVSDQQQVTVGRREDNTIFIPSKWNSVSRCEHAKIFKENNRWYLRDQKSSYGTKLNGELIAADTDIAVSGCSRVTLGTSAEYFLLLDPYFTVSTTAYLEFLRSWPLIAQLYNPAAKETLYLADTPVKLGRNHAIGSMMTSSGIGRNHGEISFRDGRYYITDKNSLNGTFVNGTQIAPHEPILLNHEDRIRLGGELYGEEYVWNQMSLSSDTQGVERQENLE